MNNTQSTFNIFGLIADVRAANYQKRLNAIQKLPAKAVKAKAAQMKALLTEVFADYKLPTDGAEPVQKPLEVDGVYAYKPEEGVKVLSRTTPYPFKYVGNTADMVITDVAT